MIYIYILILIILVALAEYVYKRGNHKQFDGKASLFICAIILAVLASVRYQNEYSDFWVNYRHVLASGDYSWLQCITGSYKGPANTLIMKFSMSVLGDPQWYFVITAFAIILGFAFFYKNYSPTYFLPIFMFYTGGAFFTSNNITRQYLALAVIYLCWKHMLDKRFIKYLLLVLLATAIHQSAVFFLPFYFLGEVRVKKNTIYVYVISGAILFLLRYQVISFLRLLIYTYYSENSYGMIASNPIRLIFVPINAFFLIYFIHNKSRVVSEISNVVGAEKSERMFNYISHGMIISILLSIFSATTFLLISRFALFFGMCNPLCYMYCIKISKPGNKKMFYLYIIAVNLLLFGYDFSHGKLCPTPYTPFWTFR